MSFMESNLNATNYINKKFEEKKEYEWEVKALKSTPASDYYAGNTILATTEDEAWKEFLGWDIGRYGTPESSDYELVKK